MTRRYALVFSLLGGALLAGAALTAWIAERRLLALRTDFAAASLVRLEQVTRDMEERFEDIGDDLRLGGELVQAATTDSERARELGALVAVVRQYRLAVLFDPQGRRVLSVLDPRAGRDFPAAIFDQALAAAAAQARARPPGHITTSAAIAGEPGGWFRVFATALPEKAGKPAGSLALLVDTEPLFARDLQLLRADHPARLLLLGAYGRPAPATDPLVARSVHLLDQGRPVPPPFGALLRAMRGGGRGTLLLDGSHAAALGIGGRGLAVAYAPIPIRDGGHWSLALLLSLGPLYPQEQALLLRLAAVALGVALCLAAAVGWALYAARRAAVLRERLRQADQLAHLHEKTEKILDHVPSGVLVLSQDERITALNRVLRERVPRTAIGGHLAQAFPHAPPAVLSRVRSLLDGARVSDRVRSVYGVRLVLFGEEGQYSLHAVPLEPRFPEARVLLVIEDLSAVRSLESQLLRAEKLATVGVLAAGIAHEIGTPLSIVRGRAEYVASKLGADHPQAAGVRVIVDQIDLVTRSLQQLLDFARSRPAMVRPVDPGPALSAVRDLFRFEAERRRLSLQVELRPDLPWLAADPDQLQQVLVNLVMNACDACAPGGHIRLTVQGDPADPERVRLEVEDDGCGIPEEHRNQVFDPFFTTKKRGQGTGLGLTIAAQIVRSHGGQIEIESEPGRGTRAVVLWPARRPEEEAHVAAG